MIFHSWIKLLYIDTDSFLYEIVTKYFYQDFINPTIEKYFDISDFPKNHECYSVSNKKNLGCFKDENKSVPILEFVAFRTRLYTSKTVNEMFVKKAKGITKSLVKITLLL